MLLFKIFSLTIYVNMCRLGAYCFLHLSKLSIIFKLFIFIILRAFLKTRKKNIRWVLINQNLILQHI